MNQDEIIEMARQAGCETAFGLTHPPILQAVAFKKSQLEAFAELVAAKEREDIAQTLEELELHHTADVIRARGW